MSEREVRKRTEQLISDLDGFMKADGIYGPATFVITQAREALSEPPDVVVILRWLEGQEKRLPMNTPVDASLDGAFKVMRHHIEQKFHVRLTAEGWEWVEDGE